MRKLGFYIRVSTEEQAKIHEGSLVSQRHRLEQYVDARNLLTPGWGKIAGVYIDEARSGKNTNRPQYQLMIQAVECGKVDTVLVTELSRLSRNMRDFCDLWEFLKAHRAQFLSLREQFDSTSAAGELMIFNIMNFAQFERKQTSERVSANFQARALRGLYNGGYPALGYDSNAEKKGCLIVNEKEAADVRRIFAVYQQTGSLTTTLKTVQAERITTKQRIKSDGTVIAGRDLCLNSMCNLLRNRHYIAEREIHKASRQLDKDEVNPGKEYKIVPASWPAIVDKSVFDSVQVQLNAQLAKYRSDTWRTFDYFCTELVYCPDCGKRLVGISGSGKDGVKHVYYAHKGKAKGCRIHGIDAEKLHECLRKRLKQLAKDEELIALLYQETEVQQAQDKPDSERTLIALEGQIKEKRKQVENLLSHLENGDAGQESPVMKRRLQEREAELLKLEQDKTALDSESVFAKDNVVDAKDLFAFVQRFDRHFSAVPPVKRRQLVRLYFGRIEVHAPNKPRFRYNRDRFSVHQAHAVLDEALGENSLTGGPSGPPLSAFGEKGIRRTKISYGLCNGGEKCWIFELSASPGHRRLTA